MKADTIAEDRRADVFVENESCKCTRLRQERHILFDRPRKTPLQTEPGKSFSGNFYKCAAPAALNAGPVSTFQHVDVSTITAFFLKHRGRCFEGWSERKVEDYVLVNTVHGNTFVALAEKFGRKGTSALPQIGLAAIAWLDDAARIMDLDARGLPQFEWEHPKGWTPNGDSILIADVAGDRKLMPEILELVAARWAVSATNTIFQKRLFTYRRGKLRELDWPVLLKLWGLKSRLILGSCNDREDKGFKDNQAS